MNLELMGRVNKLQSQLGFSDANMGAAARNFIDQDNELLTRWIAYLEQRLAQRSVDPDEVGEALGAHRMTPGEEAIYNASGARRLD